MTITDATGFGAGATASIGTYGYCFSGRLIRNVGAWQRDLRCDQVTYVAGWTQAEIDEFFSELKLAMCYCVLAFYIGVLMRSNAALDGGWVQSQSETDFSQSFGDPSVLGIDFQNSFDFPPEAARIMQRYTNLRQFFLGA